MPTELANSSFLDFNSYRSPAAALTGGTPATVTFNVGLVFDRANDPTALLNSDWGSRQQQFAALDRSGTLWSTYGADPTNYARVLTDLRTMAIPTVESIDRNNGYVSSAESRTIWVQVDQNSFATLFGQQLLNGVDPAGYSTVYWNGNLSLPNSWITTYGVKGLLFDSFDVSDAVVPNSSGGGTPVIPSPGPLSPGNGVGDWQASFPETIAEAYNFPLTGALWNSGSVPTGAIGLLEPGIGTAMPSGSFVAGLDRYRREAGITGNVSVVSVAPGGQSWIADDGLERSLDVGVVTGTNPQSTLVIYAGSGDSAGAQSDTMTAYQAAFWDETNKPKVVSSSWGAAANQPAKDSPFLWAAQQLFVDAALKNISVVSANGDGGSGNQFATGVTNVATSQTSSYILTVGGTSLSFRSTASIDPTLDTMMAAATAGDRATIWQLIAGGLDVLPSAASTSAWMIETVWNQYVLHGTRLDPGYQDNNTVTGGVDPTQPVPNYQQAFGLTPTTSDPAALVGRGNPDVSINAGGNLLYTVPNPTLSQGFYYDYGTSAAAPMWASLLSQINAVFNDQRLPASLGFMNDLLYIAAVIAPAAFNDVTIGNNTSSYLLNGPIDSEGTPVTPTGFGYSAGAGYDLTTGLGTPNGVLLARVLTTIAHEQVTYGSLPDVLDPNGSGGWKSGVTQSLLVQTTAGGPIEVTVSNGSSSSRFSSKGSSPFAWTARLAEQSLQPGFDPRLVTMFDGQAQGALFERTVPFGEGIAIAIDATPAATPQATLSAPFGFVDYTANGGTVRLSQSVAVAETVDALNDQNAVIRVRQGGMDSLAVGFYRVDDYAGTVAGLAPGSPGYAAAADARAYDLSGGGKLLTGPGYGNYTQAEITNVDSGDLIAMKLVNLSIGLQFWAFAQANTDGGTAHLWNYGTNVWGWEDRPGGGDRDYNDMVVQIDFTSASGNGWLK